MARFIQHCDRSDPFKSVPLTPCVSVSVCIRGFMVVTKCFQRLLSISYSDHVTNEEVWNIIRHIIWPYEELFTTVRKRKLRWYGHITRSTGLAKMILTGHSKKEGEGKADRKRDGKIIYQNGRY